MEDCSPEWLDKHFLSCCLEGAGTGYVGADVTSYEVQPGVAAGNNYGSDILRVTANYKTDKEPDLQKSISLIVKAPVKTVITDLLNEAFGLAEFNFYHTFMPKAQTIIPAQIAPKSFLAPIKSVIVLEDLKSTGFSMADRFEQLDFNHCKQYFMVSAKLHATGVALAKQHPELFSAIPSEQEKLKCFQAPGNSMVHAMSIGLKCLVKTIESLNVDEFKTYTECIKKITNNNEAVWQNAILSEMLTNANLFKSFVHGDCWTTNMMFKHDTSGNPIDIRLIDFQAFNYDAVVTDLINFTYMSANNDVLENSLDDLFTVYCDTLNRTLSEVGCTERLTVRRLKEEILEKSLVVLVIVGVFLPLTQAEKPIDEEIVFSGKSTVDQIMEYYQGKYFWNKFPLVLKVIAREGVFDCLETKCVEWLSNES